jgi:hypothetical protein
MKKPSYVFPLFALLIVVFSTCDTRKPVTPHPLAASATSDQYPVFGACDAVNPRPLPNKWTAATLMTPFDDSGPYFGLITYDNDLHAMRTSLFDYDGGFADLITIHDSVFLIQDKKCLQPLVKGLWSVPGPDWINGTDHNCAGTKPLLNINVQWWRYQAGSIGNWLWTRVDNGAPLRMMFVNDSNIYHLPALGMFSMVNFGQFDSLAQSGLAPIVASCRSMKSKNIPATLDLFKLITASKKNLTVSEKQRRLSMMGTGLGTIKKDTNTTNLPTWPVQFKATSIMTPVNRSDAYPTTISYDWNIKKQLTSMKQPDLSVVDAYLIDTITYIVQKLKDSIDCQGALPHLGPPQPRWAYLDRCKSKLIISDGPLSPGRKTVVFTCPIEEGRVFWIWYTTEGKPVVFYETSPPVSEGTSLSLADYFDFFPNVGIDTSEFNKIPVQCMPDSRLHKKNRFHGAMTFDANCNQCHNPVIAQGIRLK